MPRYATWRGGITPGRRFSDPFVEEEGTPPQYATWRGGRRAEGTTGPREPLPPRLGRAASFGRGFQKQALSTVEGVTRPTPDLYSLQALSGFTPSLGEPADRISEAVAGAVESFTEAIRTRAAAKQAELSQERTRLPYELGGRMAFDLGAIAATPNPMGKVAAAGNVARTVPTLARLARGGALKSLPLTTLQSVSGGPDVSTARAIGELTGTPELGEGAGRIALDVGLDALLGLGAEAAIQGWRASRAAKVARREEAYTRQFPEIAERTQVREAARIPGRVRQAVEVSRQAREASRFGVPDLQRRARVELEQEAGSPASQVAREFETELAEAQADAARLQERAAERSAAAAKAEAERDALRRSLQGFGRVKGEEGRVPAGVKPLGPKAAPERINSAAIRTEEGEVFEGSTHSASLGRAQSAGKLNQPLATVEDGFTTSHGRFVNRAEAEQIARAQGQLEVDFPDYIGDLGERRAPGIVAEQLKGTPKSPGFARRMANIASQPKPSVLTPQEPRSHLFVPTMKDAPESAIEEMDDLLEEALDRGKMVNDAVGVKESVEATRGYGVFEGKVTPNTVYEAPASVGDDGARKLAAGHGIVRGQQASVWLQAVPEGTEGAGPGLVTSMVPLRWRQLQEVIGRNPAFKALDGSTWWRGRAIFRNFSDVPQQEYERLLQQAIEQLPGDTDYRFTRHFFKGDYLDGPDAHRAVFDGDPAALQRLSDLVRRRTGPVYERVAPALGDNAESVRSRIEDFLTRTLGERGAVAAGRPAATRLPAEPEDAAEVAKGVTALFRRRGQLGYRTWAAEAGARIPAEQLPKVWQRIEAQYGRLQRATIRGDLPTLKELAKLFREGEAGMEWYDRTLRELEPVFGRDVNTFIKMLGATSINTDVVPNVTLALKAFRQWKAGEPFKGFLPAQLDALNRLVHEGGELRTGRKVNAFVKALLGDEDAVVVDRWILRAFGLSLQKAKPRQYDFVEEAIRQAAKEVGVTPRQYQAALWVAVRNRLGGRALSSESFEELTKRKLEAYGGSLTRYLNEKGFALFPKGLPGGVLTPLAGAGAGAAAGGAAGAKATETPEGAIAGAAAGAALGAGVAAGGARALQQAVTRPPRLPPRRPLSHPRPVGVVDPAGSKVQFKNFGLSAGAQQKLEAEVDQLAKQGYIPKKVRVSWNEQKTVARELGMDDIKQAWVNRDMDGTTLLAIRNVYRENDQSLANAYNRLAELATKGGQESELLQVQQSIGSIELENDQLLRMFMPKASEFGRNLNSLKILATKDLDPLTWHVKAQRLAGRDLLPEERQLITNLVQSGNRVRLVEELAKLTPQVATFRSGVTPLVTTAGGAVAGSQLDEENPVRGALLGAAVGAGVGLNPEALIALRRAGLLTGARTQVRNFLSNTGEAVMRHADNPTAVLGDRIASALVNRWSAGRIPDLRTRALVNPLDRFKASYEGAKVGISKAKSVMQGHLDPADLRKLDIPRELTLNNRFADAYVKFMHRLQGAADQPFRQGAFMESLQEQARLVARGDKDARAALMKHPPDDMVMQAIIDSEEAVFANRSIFGELVSGAKARARYLEARGGLTGKAAKAGRLAVEYVVPFTNTPGAVLGRLVERTPLGLASGVASIAQLRHLARQVGGDEAERLIEIASQQREAVTRVGRGATGTLALLLGWHWASEGKAAGSWPWDDPKEQARWKQQGKMEDGLLVDGKWRKLTGVAPVGNLIALGAQLWHSSNNPDYETTDEKIVATARGVGRGFIEQSFLRGLDDLVSAVKESNNAGDAAARGMVAGFVPTIVSDLTQTIDPRVRDPQNFADALKSKIPGYSFDVPVRLDEFGKPQVLEGEERYTRLVDPFLSRRPKTETDAVRRELARIGVAVPRLSRKTAEKGEAPETPAAKREREQLVGPERYRALQQLFATPRYDRMDEEEQAAVAEALLSRVSRRLTQRPRVPRSWGGDIGAAFRTGVRATR